MRTIFNYPRGKMPGLKWLGLTTRLLAIILLFTLTACRTTHQVRGSVEQSGFLSDYSQLQPGTGDEAKLVYIDSAANWRSYTRIYLEPVTLWNSDDPSSPLGQLSQDDQQLLVDYCYTSLYNALTNNYQMVNQAGPGVLVIRAAITEAKKSRPVSNLVSSVVPMGMALSLTKRVIFGTGLGVGECQAEVELLDGGTGQRVAAAVDRRAGTKALRTKFDGTFGDVELAIDYWSAHLAQRLTELRGGEQNTDL